MHRNKLTQANIHTSLLNDYVNSQTSFNNKRKDNLKNFRSYNDKMRSFACFPRVASGASATSQETIEKVFVLLPVCRSFFIMNNLILNVE